jgi:uncharacterized protein YcsI (UPF0317 family)
MIRIAEIKFKYCEALPEPEEVHLVTKCDLFAHSVVYVTAVGMAEDGETPLYRAYIRQYSTSALDGEWMVVSANPLIDGEVRRLLHVVADWGRTGGADIAKVAPTIPRFKR